MNLRLLADAGELERKTLQLNRELASHTEPQGHAPQPRQRAHSDGKAQSPSRELPNSREAEMGVLGSMLISPRDVIADVVAKISAEYFHAPAHQTIFLELVRLWDAGQPIELITFTQTLRDRNVLEAVGGAVFVTSLFTFIPTAANIAYYLDIVRDKFLLRQMIAKGTETVRRAFSEQDEVAVLVDQVEQSFIGMADDRFQVAIEPISITVGEAIAVFDRARDNKGAVTGLATGFDDLDNLTGGLQKTDMIVIAARPSMGKTALGMNIAAHVALHDESAVGIFSLEMSRLQLVQRMMCSHARVDLQRVRGGFLHPRDETALAAAGDKLALSKLYIDDSAGLPILELRAKARRMHSRYDVKLIVVDYLQLLRSGTKRAQENRQIEISEISAGLKGLAKELKIPLVVLAQLNRQPENRPGGRPRLSDLRESGSIEQDADIVGLLVRPEVYETDENRRREMSGEATLEIAKNRNGALGVVDLVFIARYTTFESRSRGVQEPY